jgi:transposase
MARPFDISRKISKTQIMRKLKNVINHRLKERLQTLLWYADGFDCTQIADKIGRCRQIVSKYLKIYDRGGLDELFKIGRGPGRQSRLTDQNRKTLLKWIVTSPRDMGYSFNNWDCKRLSLHISKALNIKLSDEQVRRILIQLKCRLVRPRHKMLQANPELIAKKNGKFRGLWLPPEKIEELSSSLKMR